MIGYLREIPAIHTLKNDERFFQYSVQYDLSESELTQLVQKEIDKLRSEILDQQNSISSNPTKQLFTDLLFKRLLVRIKKHEPFYLRRVINATGTILHTNLGRAKLSEIAIEKVVETAKNYSNLEFNIEEGKRGSRHDIIDECIKRITGAEAAMVVNNNAAAVYLILRALAKDKEVIVSRGQLVEIGGSFRVSSIMEESGAKLVEVGTTNKTHLYDYETAISEETAMVLKVHTSNFKTFGFTASVETDELANLKKKHDGLIFYEDLGSGALYDFQKHGIGDEPVVSKVLNMGVDVVSFSGDKLLGGPQAGIIAGKKEIIQKLKKHQLARVLRVDKMTLAALEGTLKSYEHNTAQKDVPTVRDILASATEIERKVQSFYEELQSRCSIYSCDIADETSQIGGGTMPTEEIVTKAVAISTHLSTANELSERLRLHKPAVVTRRKADKVLLDFRTISEEEALLIVEALENIEKKLRG
ncbi:L-seryl-tRNA(Sec) selenium transferase [Anaerobacillus alkalidiazotrophicus]|uniref:L-seryl-tRNA(Sec) selenium transferase n=1 Tax=Anaerobacillus alkalidiazotrophicus TaxID=472963 RepID=A0A1S2M395_9BACI|nr:L-seryl-tRNA(Sec) selenium transferase [Anaerobacillus alkalidiazotrophicus]OIJ19000.1 L-seryl-tRNA(Sec) selenium transferase [Anaerobacillus alkalidiazotrophicus]